jgi:hypothetical protein
MRNPPHRLMTGLRLIVRLSPFLLPRSLCTSLTIFNGVKMWKIIQKSVKLDPNAARQRSAGLLPPQNSYYGTATRRTPPVLRPVLLLCCLPLQSRGQCQRGTGLNRTAHCPAHIFLLPRSCIISLLSSVGIYSADESYRASPISAQPTSKATPSPLSFPSAWPSHTPCLCTCRGRTRDGAPPLTHGSPPCPGYVTPHSPVYAPFPFARFRASWERKRDGGRELGASELGGTRVGGTR